MDETLTILREKAGEMGRRVDTLRKRREKLDAQIADLESKIKAVGVVLGDVLGQNVVGLSSQPPKMSRQSAVGSLTDEVRAITKTLDHDFQAADVWATLKAADPDKHSDLEERPVRKILARLAREKDIEVIHRGSGPKGSTYRLAARTDPGIAPQDQGGFPNESDTDSDVASRATG